MPMFERGQSWYRGPKNGMGHSADERRRSDLEHRGSGAHKTRRMRNLKRPEQFDRLAALPSQSTESKTSLLLDDGPQKLTENGHAGFLECDSLTGSLELSRMASTCAGWKAYTMPASGVALMH